jgi:O-antigen ligase
MAPGRYRVESAPDDRLGFVLLACYFVLEYTRLTTVLPFLGAVRFQLVILILLVIVTLRAGVGSMFKLPAVRLMLAFALLCAFGVLYAPNTRAAFNQMMNILTYVFTGFLPLLAFVRNMSRLRLFLKIWVFSVGFVSVWAITHGGAGPGGFLTDENDCALVLVVALPFALAFSFSKSESALMRWFMRGTAALLFLGVVATFSRGGFLGLVAALGTAFLLSKKKLKIIGMFLALALPLSVIAPFVIPDKYVAEMETISDKQDSTRLNRLYFWKLAWMMYQQNPVVGVGAGNYPWTVNLYEAQLPPDQIYRHQYSGGRQCHSLYFTSLSELGTVGSVIVLMLFGRALKSGFAVRHARFEIDEDLRRLSVAFITACAGFAITAAFISVLYYPPLWHMIAFGATLQALAIQADPGRALEPENGPVRRTVRA